MLSQNTPYFKGMIAPAGDMMFEGDHSGPASRSPIT